MQNSCYKLAEKILYEHLFDRYKLALIRQEIQIIDLDIHAQDYSHDFVKTGTLHFDPVSSLYARRELLQALSNAFSLKVALVRDFLDSLSSGGAGMNERRIIELCYFCKSSVKCAASELNIPERTLYERKKVIVKKFAKICKNRDIIRIINKCAETQRN